MSISILVYGAIFTDDLKNSNLAVLALKKNCTHPYWNQLKTNPVLESSTHPLQNYTCSPLGQGAMAMNLLPVIAPRMKQVTFFTLPLPDMSLLPLEWSKLHTIHNTTGGAYKPEMSSFCVTFARQLCDNTHLPGWL